MNIRQETQLHKMLGLMMVLVVGLMVLPGSARADTLVTVKNYSGQPDVTHDAYLQSGSAYEDENYGGSDDLEIAWRTYLRDAVVRFDLPALPSGSVITSASLTLYYWDDDYIASGDWMDITIFPLKKSWTEGTGDGQGGTDRSGVSWVYRHAYPNTDTWSNAGAKSTTHDRDTAYGVTQRLGSNPGYAVAVTWSGNNVKDVVSQWYAGSRLNYGWVVDFTDSNEDGQGVHFRSSEYPSDLIRPKLDFTYIIPEPATLGLLLLGGLALLRRRR